MRFEPVRGCVIVARPESRQWSAAGGRPADQLQELRIAS